MQVAGIEAADWLLIGVLLVIAYPIWVLARHFGPLRLLLGLAVIVGAGAFVLAAATGGLILWLVFFYDDPLDPGFSASTAERVLAEELCPADPDSVRPYLDAHRDSGFYWVDVQPAGSDVLITIGVGRNLEGDISVDSGERAAYFVALSRASPGC
jgi:hypothetical protein